MSSRQLINAIVEDSSETEKEFNFTMAEKLINALNEVRFEYSRKMFRASVDEQNTKNLKKLKPQTEGPIAWEVQQQGPQ